MIIDEILDGKRDGFYVDIGAHHPMKYSNTHRFYMHGWHGLSIDAMPGSKALFDKYRKGDINVEAGVSDEAGELIFYRFEDGALNTFDASIAEDCEKKGYRLIGKEVVKVFDIMSLLDKYVGDRPIDLMDIDVEGFDERIIASINWDKYAPRVLLVEKSTDDRNNAIISNDLLVKKGYRIVAATTRTAIYQKVE